ncbi:hypothetical protein [Marinobacterium sp. BA1]|uniref:hypothetical protein n=1 Tax=Marinobacterium sp. BA1 TaxID=3138931 RepID=UPI0032E5B1D5
MNKDNKTLIDDVRVIYEKMIKLGGEMRSAAMSADERISEIQEENSKLQAEVERLRTANIDSVAVCEQALQAKAEAEQERDQLIAYQAELVRELTSCQSVLHMLAHAGEVTPVYADDAKAVLKRKSEHSLAQHDAEVIEQFARELGVFDPEYDDQEYIEVPRYTIKDYANQLRQQANEVQS